MTAPRVEGYPLLMTPLTENDARCICTWHYPVPYDVYDYSDWDTVAAHGWDISIPEKRSAEYVGFRNREGLAAFGRLSLAHPYILIGIGLRPDLCGQGLGERIMAKLIALVLKRFPHHIPALEVRTFNQRAIRCYESCGFRRVKEYQRDTLSGRDSFFFMRYEG